MPNTAAPQNAPRPRWRRWCWRLSLLLVTALTAMHEHVRWSGSAAIVASSAAPRVDFVIVPGARIHADGQPFAMLVDRLRCARELLARGIAPRILISGRGGGALAQDEVGAMRRWLQGHGVAAAAIVDDNEGLRTIDTMRRCREVFGGRSAVVVTNPFHCARAVFLGRQLGLDVTGVEAPSGVTYSRATLTKNHGREVLARIWAWCEVFVLPA